MLSKAVTVFTPARRKKSESTFEKKSSLSTSTSRSSGEVSVDHSSPAISKSDLSDQLDNETDSEKEGNSSVPSTAIEIMPSSKMTGFVLFGVHGSKRLQSAYLRLAQIDVAGKDDDSFFDEMIVQYKKLRGFLRRNFSIWIFHTCDFIRV